MVLFTLVYFIILFIHIVKKRGFDVSAYIVLLYVITSFCSVLMFSLDFVDAEKRNISLIPTLIYCALITLSIRPIYKLNYSSISSIAIKNSKVINCITYFYFVYLLYFIIVHYQGILFVLAYGDWDSLRADVMGNWGSSSISRAGGLLQLVDTIFHILGSASFIMFPIFFVSLAMLNKSRLFCIIAFLGTTTTVLSGVLAADRSNIFYWIILLGLCLVMFWKRLTKPQKKFIVPLVASMLLIVMVYFASVTTSRFKDSDAGTRGGLITYAGQPYINFCYFWDNFNNREGITTKALFPSTHYFILKDYEGGVERQQKFTAKTGITCSVFYTFLGAFIIDDNQIGPFIFIALYLVLFSLFSRYKKKDNTISLYGFIGNYVFTVIPTCGCIAYMYGGPLTNLSIIVLLIFVILITGR